MRRALLAVLVCACSEGTAEVAPPDLPAAPTLPPPAELASCQPEQWCWVTPRPTGESLDAACVAPDGVLFAVGGGGTVLRVLGGDEVQPLATPEPAKLTAVTGTASDDVWLLGDRGTAWHFDGSRFEVVDTGASIEFADADARAPDDVWAVGDRAEARHWDGEAWRYVGVGSRGQRFEHVEVGARSVWVGGRAGLYRLDGHVRQVRGEPVSGLCLLSDDEVWVREGQTLRRWDGHAWSTHTLPSTRPFPSELDCRDGELWLHAGTVIARRRGEGPWEWWRVGSDEVRYGGQGWPVSPVAHGMTVGALANGPRRLWAVGARGALFRYHENVWLTTSAPSYPAMESVAAIDETRAVYATSDGAVYELGANGAERMGDVAEGGFRITAVAGHGDTVCVAMARFEGEGRGACWRGRWIVEDSRAPLRDVSVSATEALFVGADGVVGRFADERFSRVTFPGSRAMSFVAVHLAGPVAWLVTDDGRVVRRDESGYRVVAQVGWRATDAWGNARELWVGTSRGLRYVTERGFANVDECGDVEVTAVGGRGRQVLAVARERHGRRTIACARSDGAWRSAPLPTGHEPNGVAVLADRELVALRFSGLMERFVEGAPPRDASPPSPNAH